MGIKHTERGVKTGEASPKSPNGENDISHSLTGPEKTQLLVSLLEQARNGGDLALMGLLLLAFLAKGSGDFELDRESHDAVLQAIQGLETEGVSKRRLRKMDTSIDLLETTERPAFEICYNGHAHNKRVRKPDTRPSPVTTPSLACARLAHKLLRPSLDIQIETNPSAVIDAIATRHVSDMTALDLSIQAHRHSFRVSYDELICLPTLRNVKSLSYQEETARKLLKDFRGVGILADEVGLGKTVEASIILKEYQLRGLIRSALILVPSALVNQWKEELTAKFEMEFMSSTDPLFHQDPRAFWENPFVVASLQSARRRPHFDVVVSRSYDLVIVDEAHHLKNQDSKSWRLVNSLKKSFMLLLTATPVQNKLEDLYSLVTLLKPGHLKTQGNFKAEFISRGKPTSPRNRNQLKELLKGVMIRNTRATCGIALPARVAVTKRVELSDREIDFYNGISNIVTSGCTGSPSKADIIGLRKLLEKAGSSCSAAVVHLERMEPGLNGGAKGQVVQLIELGQQIPTETKALKLIELLRALEDQAIVFVKYRDTLRYLRKVLGQQGIAPVVFHGGLTPVQKQTAVDQFRGGCPVFLATGIGGEGHNLQFCNVVINYDLPWNPMEIEHRTGRVDRIGQIREVSIYNLCAAGTIEEQILNVLHGKINMFELVIGELGMILGRLEEEKDFGASSFDLWTSNQSEAARKQAFEKLGLLLQRAKRDYDKTKVLDQELFGEEFGI